MRKLKLDLDYGNSWDQQVRCNFTKKILKTSVQSGFEDQSREQMREVLDLFKKLDASPNGEVELTDDDWTKLYTWWKNQKVKYVPDVLEMWEVVDKEMCPDDYAESSEK